MENTGQADLGNSEKIFVEPFLIPGYLTIHQQISAEIAAKLFQPIRNCKAGTKFEHSAPQPGLGYVTQE